ncbi:MAG: fluoride efflux transporter CrcB [Hyphomicrobiaceae bacterium]
MRLILLAAAGGAIGSAARFLVNQSSLRAFGSAFPWATLTVNVVGGLLMGLVFELVARRFGNSNELRVFLATGVLGGFTTFSAFTLDVAELNGRGELGLSLLYIGASVALAIAALYVGLAVGRWLFA